MENGLFNAAEKRMQKSVEALGNELSKLRTGRAHPALLEHVQVDYYGSPTPLSQVASISVQDARTLQVAPWEKNLIPVIEKAIMTADLGLNPVTAGESIRIPLPPLTEDRRKEFIKLVRSECENSRISIRNARRDVNNEVKQAVKDKTMTEDDERRAQDRMQKLTDKYIKEVDALLANKEKDLMEI